MYIDCNALEKSSHCLNLTHFLLTSMLTCPCNQLYKPNPGDSAGKESTYNVRYLGSIPGLGRSPGERIGYPLQCSWASLVAQMAKNQPTVQADSLPAEPRGKPKYTGVGSLPLLQQIFLTQELNQGLLYSRQILYQLSHKGSPRTLEWVAYPFSRGSSQLRN